MTKRPIPKMKVGIVHLQIVKESRVLYGMRRFTNLQEAVEIVVVGGLNNCIVDVQNIFKYSILNNAAFVVCIHNHPSGDPEPSRKAWLRLRKTGIGGSDAGAVCGLNPYASQMSVYRDKVSDQVMIEDNESMR